eukprot:CAMPEP_0197433212 /NCGR_PEP_ID=MMETSP1175-20131217/1138_1 /TAXON_ID=1003142 /ORGANISM="Triceratium dubium, Strain CCMP147" /LENGTH=388 /DNA_ID=CAMNT_0042961523 /DNA_START=109 /DNA_END=1275 /DNA_ORIENTATION=+
MSSRAPHRPNAAATATALLLLTATSAPALTDAAQDDLCPIPNELPPNFARTCVDLGEASGDRCWITYTPPAAAATDSGVPLVVDMHGFTSCAFYNPTYTGWKERADADGFVVVYPQGTANSDVVDATCFNAGQCCCFKDFARVDEADDVVFLRKLVDDTVAKSEVPIDTDRIYMAGHSNGCMMAQRMGAEVSDMVAAVCCHAGVQVAYGTAENFPTVYNGSTSVLTVHGDADDTVPYDGGGFLGFRGAEDNAALWAEANGCAAGPVVIEDESGSFATHAYSDCGNDGMGEVKLIQLYGVGHAPYMTTETTPEGLGNMTDVDTTKLAQDFCFQHRLTSPSAVGPTRSPSQSPSTSQAPTQSPSTSDATSMLCSTVKNVVMILAVTLLLR